jgi:hypothetical protein
VDIAVLFDRNDPDFIRSRIDEILVQLPRSFRKDIHPVAMNSAGEALLKQIFAKGECLLVIDPSKLAEFKMIAYARIAGFSYYLEKMQAGLVRGVLENTTGDEHRGMSNELSVTNFKKAARLSELLWPR